MRHHARSVNDSPLAIPPHGRLAGCQLAGWTPATSSPPAHRVHMDPDVAIPLPDGTILRSDLYRPASPGRYPVLVAWSSYTKDLQNTGLPLPINEVGTVRRIVSRGYAHLTVNARGTGRSGGSRSSQFDPREQRDVADVIEWAAAQPWCDGKVGMAGMSYFAVIQYLAAAARPPHLTAIFPYLGWTDFYRHAVYHGGAPQSEFFSYYYALVGATQGVRVPPAARHALGYLLDHAWFQQLGLRAFLPLRGRLSARLRPQESWARDYVSLMFDHPTDGPFYRDKSPWPVLDRIDVPVCIGTNWGNPGLHMRGAFDAWRNVRGPRWLFIGPPDARWPWQNYQDELLAWYDWQLKGISNGYQALPPVRYWMQGAGQWRSAAGWPPPGAEPVTFHLAPTTGRASDLHALGPAPPPSAELSYLAVPPGMRIPGRVNRYEAQVIRYATRPFQRPVEIAGPATLRLSLRATATDTHLIARMSDLSPDGRRRTLSFGWLQASYRAIDSGRSSADEIVHDFSQAVPLHPGREVELSLSLTPTANRFHAGHRLVLEIGSRPDLLQATALEGFVYFPYHAPPYPSRNTISHGATACSQLTVWRLPAASGKPAVRTVASGVVSHRAPRGLRWAALTGYAPSAHTAGRHDGEPAQRTWRRGPCLASIAPAQPAAALTERNAAASQTSRAAAAAAPATVSAAHAHGSDGCPPRCRAGPLPARRGAAREAAAAVRTTLAAHPPVPADSPASPRPAKPTSKPGPSRAAAHRRRGAQTPGHPCGTGTLVIWSRPCLPVPDQDVCRVDM